MRGGADSPLIAAVDAKITDSAALEALDELVGARADLRADPQLYRKTFEALAAAASADTHIETTHARADHYRQVLLQNDCAARPLIFHHGVASLLTSDNARAARAVSAAVSPTIRAMLADGPPGRALLIFLLVARSYLEDIVPRAQLSRWHLEAFPFFARADLALPYSVMFNAHHFAMNRADLLQRYCTAAQIRDAEPALGLRHLLLLEWLGAPSAFSDPRNRDLLDSLQRALPAANYADDKTAETAAARSLILRHWKPGSVLDKDTAEALGLGAAVVKVAAARSAAASTIAPPSPLARIEHRPFQALHAARNLAAHYAPFLARRDRAIRVAVCVSGQLRGYRTALATWRRILLPHVAHDVFVHTWARIGRAGAQPFRAELPFDGTAFCAAWRNFGTLEGYEAMQARYPALFAALDVGGTVSENALRQTYKARAVVVEDESAPAFAAFSNQDKMHYKIWAAHRLAQDSGAEHDLILRIRPDYGLRLAAFAWADLAQACRKHALIWVERPLGVHYGSPMIGDQLALGAPEAMSVYSSAWKTYPALARLGFSAAPESFEGHVTLAQTTWLNGVETRRLPLKGLGLLEPERLPAAAIRKALRRDTAARDDAIDRALLQANAQDMA